MRTALLLAVALGVPATARAEVAGRVRFEGPRPKLEPLDLRTDPVCSAAGHGALANHTLVGPKGGLANVFVYVADPPPGDHATLKAKPVVLDQQGCRYVPKVFGILTGQTLQIRNSDPTVHTVHAYTFRGFNVVTPRKGQRVNKTFSRPKVMVPLRCDVHPWMAAYAGVLTHPYFAVTDAEGRFRIPHALPDGDYEIRFWHEKLGRRSARVVVRGGDGRVDAVFRPETDG